MVAGTKERTGPGPSEVLADAPLRLPAMRKLLNSPERQAIAIIAVWKLAGILVFLLAYLFVPFSVYERSLNDLIYPAEDLRSVTLTSHFSSWDSSHYLYLADKGYHAEQNSNWFLPLYPMSVRVLDLVTGNSIVSGLLISNVASAGALFLFFRFVKKRYDTRTAIRALLLFVAFPTSFFLSIVYSEGVFLFFAMVFFTCLYERRFGWATLAAFFLPSVRFVGFLAIVPFAVFLVTAAAEGLTETGKPAWAQIWRRLRPNLVYLCGPIAGLAAYFLFMYATTGDPFSAQKAASHYDSGWTLTNLLRPDHVLHRLFGEHLVFHRAGQSPLDRAAFLAFLAALPLVYRKVDKPLFLWCLFMGLTPFLGTFESYLRYMMLAFPLYIAFGSVLAGRGHQALRVSLYPLVIFQVFFMALHVSDFWIA